MSRAALPHGLDEVARSAYRKVSDATGSLNGSLWAVAGTALAGCAVLLVTGRLDRRSAVAAPAPQRPPVPSPANTEEL
jgi:hypothetical protein